MVAECWDLLRQYIDCGGPAGAWPYRRTVRRPL